MLSGKKATTVVFNQLMSSFGAENQVLLRLQMTI